MGQIGTRRESSDPLTCLDSRPSETYLPQRNLPLFVASQGTLLIWHHIAPIPRLGHVPPSQRHPTRIAVGTYPCASLKASNANPASVRHQKQSVRNPPRCITSVHRKKKTGDLQPVLPHSSNPHRPPNEIPDPVTVRNLTTSELSCPIPSSKSRQLTLVYRTRLPSRLTSLMIDNGVAKLNTLAS